ncbi:hypothetical protein SSUD12_0158 [Streptococcus suis D12]|uniref:Uncharacterized protein n=2 Tax=Streptococcus suis TaxID=1307 RepID=G7SD94_STRSU|nr:hypothetical protein SSUD12_0158 [Streptococcus suis D12]
MLIQFSRVVNLFSLNVLFIIPQNMLMVKGFGRKMEKCQDFQKFGISEGDKSKK